jgi:HPr kinase/phosphorylase
MSINPSEELLHATCAVIGTPGVLLLGKSGAGKSDLALRLICVGGVPPHLPDAPAMLVADDQVCLSREDGKLIARPPRNIAGKLEVRGIGILDVPYAPAAEVKLAVRLVPYAAVPRLPPEPLPREVYCGVSLPVLLLDPFEPSAPLKLRLAIYQLR